MLETIMTDKIIDIITFCFWNFSTNNLIVRIEKMANEGNMKNRYLISSSGNE